MRCWGVVYLSIFMVGCPSKIGRISGVYFSGERIPDKYEIMLDHVYFEHLQEGKNPVTFTWNFEEGWAFFSIQDRLNISQTVESYAFSFGKDAFEVVENGKIITYRATLIPSDKEDHFFMMEIDEYEMAMEENARIYRFKRHDYRITHYDPEKILGRAFGAEMKLLGVGVAP